MMPMHRVLSNLLVAIILILSPLVSIVTGTLLYPEDGFNYTGGEARCKWQEGAPATIDDRKYSLQCHANSISNAGDVIMSNLSYSKMDRIVSLHLQCVRNFYDFDKPISDPFDSSVLATSFVTRLPKLQQLKIECCKFGYIKVSLIDVWKELQHLELHTSCNSLAGDLKRSPMASSLFQPDNFQGTMPRLQYLDIASNNLWSLPSYLFCPLTSLRHLNLSSNLLQDVISLGFSDWGNGPAAPGKSCNNVLELLDLSSNKLANLQDNSFTSLRSLHRLYLQNNVMVSVADRAFRGLIALQFLHMSNNRLSALPPELFLSSRNLKELHLSNNTISILAPGVLEGLDQLLILDLSHNELNNFWVNKDSFSGLVKLLILNLSYNQLTKIDSYLFQDLNNLQVLDLEHNRIESMASGCFKSLKSLKALKLSYNRLVALNAHHFIGVWDLYQLFLDRNNISSIEETTFKNCSDLQEVGLYGNDLNAVPQAVKNLHNLKILDLGGSRLESISNVSFNGLDQLTNLILSDNQISNISKGSFESLVSLKVLNLESNLLHRIDESIFGNVSSLQALRLDSNYLDNIDDVLTPLKSLVWLNVSNNRLHSFNYTDSMVNLEWLDLHKNRISNMANHMELLDKLKQLQLKMLDLSFNSLTEIDPSLIPESVELLFLNNNVIKMVKPNTFSQKPNLKRVVLVANQIKNLEISALKVSSNTTQQADADIPQFFMSDNPFICDCTIEWMQKLNTIAYRERQYANIIDIDLIMCSVIKPQSEMRYLTKLPASQFLCPYTSHCFPVCNCCDYDACDCEMICPANCSCYHDKTWSSNIVDCSNAGYPSVPKRIPMDATEIYLDGNNIDTLHSHVFIGKKRLHTLYLNNSNIGSIHNRTFNGVDSLRILHLENNALQTLHGFEFDGLEQLNELYLEYNLLHNIAPHTFITLQNLQILRLEQNRIESFASIRSIKSTKLATVTMTGNLWSCDCTNIHQLLMWFEETGNILVMEDLYCGEEQNILLESAVKLCLEEENDNNGKFTLQYPKLNINKENSVYELSNRHNNERRNAAGSSSGNPYTSFDYAPFLAGIMLLFICVFLISTLIFTFKEEAQLWLFTQYGIRVPVCPTLRSYQHSDNDDDKLFDVYVVYSMADDQFVTEILSSNLQRLGHTLYLHHKDMPKISSKYFIDNVLGASNASKRILFVLSHNLLQNEFQNMCFKSAMQMCLKNYCNINGGIISILLNPTIINAPQNAIFNSRELQSILTNSSVLSWGEKRFWQKLRYLLPDIKPRPINNLKIANLSKCVGGRSVRLSTNSPTNSDHSLLYKIHNTNLMQQPSIHTSSSSCKSEPSPQCASLVTQDDNSGQHIISNDQNNYMVIDYHQRQSDLPQHQHHVYCSIPDTSCHSVNQTTYFV